MHFPGTVLNDQYQGADPWEANLAQLEARTPVIEGIGVTDYYSLETYERLRASKAGGRLPACGVIFPNIEMRLAFGTVKGQWVNVHLLVSPERDDHVNEARRFLGRLTFDAYEDTFACTPGDLIRLGKAAGATGDDHAAQELGSQQFKVSFDQLRESYRKTAWARENTLIVVAGGDDGAGGLRDGSDATTRQEVLRLAHAVFASSPAQQKFWLGQRAAGADELWEKYAGPKPCLHGSDGHDLARSGAPDGDRFSWIKGDPTFDALRQACIDPGSRAFVGPTPPVSALPSQVIKEVAIVGADWAATPTLALNPGLIAIIGARGSGKTALADIIAAGCDALPERTNTQSFLYRAREFFRQSPALTGTWTSSSSGRAPRSSRPRLAVPARASHLPRLQGHRLFLRRHWVLGGPRQPPQQLQRDAQHRCRREWSAPAGTYGRVVRTRAGGL